MRKLTPPAVLVVATVLLIAAAGEAQQSRSGGRAGGASFGWPPSMNRTGTLRSAPSHSGRAANIDRLERPRRHHFLHPGTGIAVAGAREAVETQVVVEQTQPVPAVPYRDPMASRVYVQPRWVDGGHGVEVLQPGYWAESKRAAEDDASLGDRDRRVPGLVRRALVAPFFFSMQLKILPACANTRRLTAEAQRPRRNELRKLPPRPPCLSSEFSSSGIGCGFAAWGYLR